MKRYVSIDTDFVHAEEMDDATVDFYGKHRD